MKKKTSKELINDLRDSGVITEEFKLLLLIAIKNEKLDIEEELLGDMERAFKALEISKNE